MRRCTASLSLVLMMAVSGQSFGADLSLAGAGSFEHASGAQSSAGAGDSAAKGTDAAAGAGAPSADERVQILGSHSTLTNEQVAQEYEWVKVNLAGEYMPYVIDHAAGNPNVIHFLYERGNGAESPENFSYTEEEKNASLYLLGEDVRGLVPLLMQWDWRWGFDHYGGGPAGLTACAPTCMAMIGYGLTGDESITPRSMCVQAEQSGYWVSGQGTSWDFVTNALPGRGITSMRISADPYTVKAELDAGHPVLVNVGVGRFSAVGHFMVLSGTDAEGRFILNDPNNLENCSQTWSWDELGPEVLAAWSYSKG